MTEPRVAADVLPASRIRLHDLAIRPDRGEWIVGRFETRQFVALPKPGAVAIDLLGAGLTVEQAEVRLADEEGCEFDVLFFVRELIELGFVAEIDHRPVPFEVPRPASFPRVRPEHVRFALSPVLPMLFGCLLLAAVVALALRPDLLPSFQDLLWSPQGSLVLALSFVGGWSLIFVHELAHFVTARATGVHARIQLGTRLQFLVAETDISGIELAPRRHRLTAYSAGMAVNLSVAAIAVLLLVVTDETAIMHKVLAAVMLLALLGLPFQLLVFMRTDVYFILQDVTGCRDLFGDGTAYARYIGNRLWGAITGRGQPPKDPSRHLPVRERRVARVYSAFLVFGTALCLAAMAAFSIPADVTLIFRAVTRLGPDQPMTTNLDSIVVLLVLGTAHTLWAVTWWRRRR
ncbi:M50 family metallopeptidase [Nocardia sp. NBC_01730]|uniref:site-2 protease family protein n=1 Tax=Nocardia sp. NBC_01730 TaxID=2975998 RepID=UPI002E11D70D|nr:M50 family metallopeptidase [Nocardia sp. NBC_01730]